MFVHKNMIATKALACNLAKAAWHVMAGNTNYDEKRMFPELAEKPKQKIGTVTFFPT